MLPTSPSPAAVTGSAQLTTYGQISGFEVFRWTTFGQEASVPLETRDPASFVLPIDDTSGLTTGLAIANLSSEDSAINSITMNVYNGSGGLVKAEQIALAPGAHTSFMLPATYSETQNLLGAVEFVTPKGGRISVIGLRAQSNGTLTTIPVLAQ